MYFNQNIKLTTRPEKKPNIIRRWFRKMLLSDELNYDSSMPDDIVRDPGLNSTPLILKIYRANGGTIVEATTHDRNKDRTTNQLHIIGNDQDLSEGLAKIITIESLRSM